MRNARAEQVLRRLELTVTQKLDGMLHGEHQGLRPGPGTEPGEARLYQPGDDVRHIDWAVTARTGEPHVRMPVAERELETWVVVDLSASLDFGTADQEKRDVAVAAVAAVGYLTARIGNRVGALIVDGRGLSLVPARTGRDHLRALLHRVITAPRADGQGATDLAEAIVEVDRLAQRRGLAVVVSDFLSDTRWGPALRALGAKHEVLAIEVVDPRELELPYVGVLDLVDPETGARIEVQTADPALRARYATAAAAQRERIERVLVDVGADHLVLRTDRDWLLDIVQFVDRRRRRQRGVA